MSFTLWLMFALTEGALTVAPGPAVLLVVSQGLRSGSRGALLAAAGILAANGLYFAVSGTSLGALLLASRDLFALVKWAGAGYLVYLGASALLRRPLPAGGPCARGEASDLRSQALFSRGFLLQVSNPKALLFFVAILPQFIDRGRPVLLQLCLLGVTSVVMEFAVLAAYGAAAARAVRLASEPRFATLASRASGALLLAAALGLSRLEQ